MPHQGESRVTFHLSTQAAETKHPREGRPHNAGAARGVGMPSAETSTARNRAVCETPTLTVHDKRSADFDVRTRRGFGVAIWRRQNALHSFPSTWDPTERIKSPTAHFRIPRTAIATVGVLSWGLSEHVIATAGPGPCEVRMSPKMKKWQRFAVVNGRLTRFRTFRTHMAT